MLSCVSIRHLDTISYHTERGSFEGGDPVRPLPFSLSRNVAPLRISLEVYHHRMRSELLLSISKDRVQCKLIYNAHVFPHSPVHTQVPANHRIAYRLQDSLTRAVSCVRLALQRIVHVHHVAGTLVCNCTRLSE